MKSLVSEPLIVPEYEDVESYDAEAMFAVDIPSDTVAYLQQCETAREKQDVLDAIFTPERREVMIDSASQDMLGRQVVYYRQISIEALETLLTTGKHDRFSYVNNPDELIDVEAWEMYEFFDLCFSNKLRREGFTEEEIDEHTGEIDDLSFEEKLRLLFGDTTPEDAIRQVVDTPSQRNVIQFMDMYVPYEDLAWAQVGVFRYFPDVSMSVGGFISERLAGLGFEGKRSCYLECIIDDDDIHISPYGNEAEREVFVRRITPSQISRIYTDDYVMVEAIFNDPRIALGHYYQMHTGEIEGDLVKQLPRHWIKNEKTTDCLPESLQYEPIG